MRCLGSRFPGAPGAWVVGPQVRAILAGDGALLARCTQSLSTQAPKHHVSARRNSGANAFIGKVDQGPGLGLLMLKLSVQREHRHAVHDGPDEAREQRMSSGRTSPACCCSMIASSSTWNAFVASLAELGGVAGLDEAAEHDPVVRRDARRRSGRRRRPWHRTPRARGRRAPTPRGARSAACGNPRGHRGQQRLLVGEMAVERGARHPQRLADAAQRQRVDALLPESCARPPAAWPAAQVAVMVAVGRLRAAGRGAERGMTAIVGIRC